MGRGEGTKLIDESHGGGLLYWRTRHIHLFTYYYWQRLRLGTMVGDTRQGKRSYAQLIEQPGLMYIPIPCRMYPYNKVSVL